MTNELRNAINCCTDNFIMCECSICPRKKLYNSTKLCRDDLIKTLATMTEKIEKENEELKELVSDLHKEINNGKV